jgi:hypothetical protein
MYVISSFPCRRMVAVVYGLPSSAGIYALSSRVSHHALRLTAFEDSLSTLKEDVNIFVHIIRLG